MKTRNFDENGLRTRGSSLERTVFINPANAGERYFAIYGSNLLASSQQTIPVITTSTSSAGTAFFTFYSGRDIRATRHPSPTGSFELEVSGLTSKQ